MAEPISEAELQRKAEALIEEYESPVRKLQGVSRWIVWVLALAISAWALYGAFGTPQAQILRMIHVTLVLMCTFLLYPATRWDRKATTPVDWALVLLALAAQAYVLWDYEKFIYRVAIPRPLDLAAGTIVVILVLEACRRTAGWVLTALILVAMGYAYLGALLPAPWTHKGYDLDRIISHSYMGLEGIFGVPIDVSATFIILFIMYGAILDATGAGKFFVDFSFSVLGKKPTGAGRTAILSSFLLGGPSGSGVATTVTVGAVAYPIMKKSGYDPDTAGGILAAGGIGAVISPPVLGAASFIIAEVLKMSYLDVIIMSIMPTVLYYLGILLMIELDGRRMNLKPVEIQTPLLTHLLKTYWYHFSSLVAIVAFMAMGFTAVYAVLLSMGVGIVFSWLRADTRVDLRKLIAAMEAAGKQILSVAPVCAAAGILVGVVTLTGLGLKFSGIIIDLAGGSLWLTLVYTAAILLVLGLALPITASYIVAYVMTVPAMIKLGVPEYAAHMFVFYYAVLSEVSPPVALSPVAASALTGGNPWRTMMITWKYALPTFLVPFMFTSNPVSGPMLLWRDGLWYEMAWVSLSACIGVVALVSGVGGYLFDRLSWPERLLLIAGGLLLFYADPKFDVPGVALAAAGALVNWVRSRRKSHAAAAQGRATRQTTD